MALTIEGLKNINLLLFESISGSKAYGLDSAASDTDIRGVFVLDQEEYYGLHYVEQISNASNDEVYYELGHFVELLARNNPSTYCKEYKEYWQGIQRVLGMVQVLLTYLAKVPYPAQGQLNMFKRLIGVCPYGMDLQQSQSGPISLPTPGSR